MPSSKKLPQPTQVEKMKQAQKAKTVAPPLKERQSVKSLYNMMMANKMLDPNLVKYMKDVGMNEPLTIEPTPFHTIYPNMSWDTEPLQKGVDKQIDNRDEGEKWADEWISKLGKVK